MSDAVVKPDPASFQRSLMHLLFWISIGSIYYLLIDSFKASDLAPWRTLTNVICLALIYYSARWLTQKLFERGKKLQWLSGILSAAIITSALRTVIELYVFNATIFHYGLIRVGTQLSITILLFFFLLSLIFFSLSCLYCISKNRMLTERKLYESDFRRLEAELNLLKAQLNPHFLFNTLNNIYAASMLQSTQTPDMILKLSEILQFLTYEANAQRVPLSKEIQQVRNYVSLHQLMAADQLPLEISFESDAGDVEVPPMLLLPLIENIFKHGNVVRGGESVFASINIIYVNQQLYLHLRNTYDNHSVKTAGGIGLINLAQRLKLGYPDRHSLSISRDRDIYELNLKIDCNEQ